MHESVWFSETTNLRPIDGGSAVPDDLQQVAHGEVALTDALLTLAYHAGEQTLVAADLLERETWALTALLERCAPIWQYLADPILRFAPERADQPRLELGIFSHLAALVAPSPDEQALIATRTPRWARVSPAPDRERAQQTGALACSYVAISAAEAIAIVGFQRILARLTTATCIAGQALATQAQSHHDRQARLAATERSLGVVPESATAAPGNSRGIYTYLALSLLGPVRLTRWALAGAIWILVVILVSFLVNLSPTLFLLLLGAGLTPVQLYLGAQLAARGDRSAA
jgi:hypothetical protein